MVVNVLDVLKNKQGVISFTDVVRSLLFSDVSKSERQTI